MSRSAASPRGLQFYSPRRPSPLGLPPLSAHDMGSHDRIPCNTAYPKTPERYYFQFEPTSSSHHLHGMRFPPDAHCPLGNNTQRAGSRAPPPAPLSLDTQHHPAAAVVHLPSIEQTLQQQQPHATQDMHVPSSSTSSSTSSLSLYSSDSAKRSLPMEVIQEEEEEEEEEGRKKGGGGGGGFCLCFSAFLNLSLTYIRYPFLTFVFLSV